MNGVEGNKIIVDSWSGEAMNPKFAHLYRNYCVAISHLEDVEMACISNNINWEFYLLYDGPFVWRPLTEEEKEWCEEQYRINNPW
jgi:hypothetical protein